MQVEDWTAKHRKKLAITGQSWQRMVVKKVTAAG